MNNNYLDTKCRTEPLKIDSTFDILCQVRTYIRDGLCLL